MNLASTVVGPAAGHDPEHIAVRLDEVALNYAAIDIASAHLAGLLAGHGIVRGDRVGIMLPNLPHFPVCYYGALRRGAVVVPMNVLLKRREVAYYLSDSGAKLLFAWEGFAEEAQAGAEEAGAECIVVTLEGFAQLVGAAAPEQAIADVEDEDTAVLLYTSGTTGQPKGAELTHANLTSNANASRKLFTKGAEAICLGALPLFHSFGQTCGLNATVAGGGTLTLIPRFDPGKALEIIERDKVNLFEGVPTMYSAMLHCENREKFDVSTLKLCVSGGSAMPVELMRGFEEAFGCKILEGYGLSESSPVASFNPPDRERKPGSIGIPIEGVEMKVVDDDGKDVPQGEVGEIVIRGHNVMKGYWEKPDATAETLIDGWLHTGDMAKIDEDGYFFIVDRKKDLIIRGGYNVYPREVEEVLYEHPAVREAAVVGIKDDQLGEEVGAAVALKDGQDASADELRAFVKDQVAAYKYPRRVWFVDDLPKGPTGKILKREIEPPDPD
ncbi:MAG TPA: long-chain fatty acid--CoA ligase [Solirubrobacteraceae bacterium]